MAETSGLLNRRTGDSRTEGSNPSVSANFPADGFGRDNVRRTFYLKSTSFPGTLPHWFPQSMWNIWGSASRCLVRHWRGWRARVLALFADRGRHSSRCFDRIWKSGIGSHRNRHARRGELLALVEELRALEPFLDRQ